MRSATLAAGHTEIMDRIEPLAVDGECVGMKATNITDQTDAAYGYYLFLWGYGAVYWLAWVVDMQWYTAQSIYTARVG